MTTGFGYGAVLPNAKRSTTERRTIRSGICPPAGAAEAVRSSAAIWSMSRSLRKTRPSSGCFRISRLRTRDSGPRLRRSFPTMCAGSLWTRTGSGTFQCPTRISKSPSHEKQSHMFPAPKARKSAKALPATDIGVFACAVSAVSVSRPNAASSEVH